jgi:glycosyltransferase involved in cell wall biosynthesis
MTPMSAVPNLVSVIMPAYNGARYLAQAIESLFAQTYPAWELVFIDDGSTDETAAIAQSYSDPRIRYTYQRNAGQAAALNRGLDLARGEFITTLDVDDWLTPDSLAARVEKLRSDPDLAAVYGDGVFCTSEGAEIKRFRTLVADPPEGDIYPALISNAFFGTGANILERRSTLELHGIRYDESLVWCQDFDFYLRIAEVGRYGRVPIPTVWYRQHDANMTASMASERRMESMLRTKQRVMESKRFSSIPLEGRLAFFYELLRNDLFGLQGFQSKVLDRREFRALPAKEQARLLRLVGVRYLSSGRDFGFAADCMDRACSAHPRDWKSQLLALLLKLDVRLARLAVRAWSTPSVEHA